MSYITDSWQKAAENVIKKFEKRGIAAFYCATKEEAKDKVLSLIPAGSTVTAGGSESMVQSGVMDAVTEGGYQFIDRTAGKTPEETKAIYSRVFTADYFLMSANAFTRDGELVNIDGVGNRVACLSFGPSHVIVMASMNKMCRDVTEAIKRAHTLACPPNAIRVKADTPCARTGLCADCQGPSSICCQTLVTRSSRTPGRITVILVGEPLGF